MYGIVRMDSRPPTDGVISSAFLTLQRLDASFAELRDGRPASSMEEAELLRLAAQLGATALPVLGRNFAGDDEGRAVWAHALLFHLGREPRLQVRIVADLEALVRRPGVADRTRMRAIALLAELGTDPPEDAPLADPESARRRSSRELALCLGTPADVARAGDHLLEQLSSAQLLDLFDDLVEGEPGSALILLDELLVRDGLDEDCRHELRQRRAAARQLAPRAAPLRWRRRASDAVACRAGRHTDGRRILMVSDRQPGSRPARRRLLCVLVAANGVLLDAHYGEDLTASGIESEFLVPLEREGFALAATALASARGFFIRSARLAVRAGRVLPRAFYLGRHLLGVRDEHLDGTARCPAAVDLAALLDRAIVLIASGEPEQALPLLERYVGEAPDDAEGHAQLGVCRLTLGDPGSALDHLARATWLAPDEPLYQWNTAAAAHRAGLAGTCYLALESYRGVRDVAPGADERRRIADRYADEYARLAVLEHPGTSPRAVASAEGDRRRGRPRSRRRQRG
jgi:tetratricopeptide (TPR) repeat protein